MKARSFIFNEPAFHRENVLPFARLYFPDEADHNKLLNIVGRIRISSAYS